MDWGHGLIPRSECCCLRIVYKERAKRRQSLSKSSVKRFSERMEKEQAGRKTETLERMSVGESMTEVS